MLLSSLPPGQALPLLSDPLGAATIMEEREEGPPPPTAGRSPSNPKQALFPAHAAIFKQCTNREGQKRDKEDEEEEDEDEEEDHFRHRRLTGDSGIEVCRCHVRRSEEERLQKGHPHDSTDVSRQDARPPHVDDGGEQRFIQKTGEAVMTAESS